MDQYRATREVPLPYAFEDLKVVTEDDVSEVYTLAGSLRDG